MRGPCRAPPDNSAQRLFSERPVQGTCAAGPRRGRGRRSLQSRAGRRRPLGVRGRPAGTCRTPLEFARSGRNVLRRTPTAAAPARPATLLPPGQSSDNLPEAWPPSAAPNCVNGPRGGGQQADSGRRPAQPDTNDRLASERDRERLTERGGGRERLLTESSISSDLGQLTSVS